tara:strand:- start:70 stop:294 length:225 start_codon:yes stop_codon:yes gene_type:complete
MPFTLDLGYSAIVENLLLALQLLQNSERTLRVESAREVRPQLTVPEVATPVIRDCQLSQQKKASIDVAGIPCHV